MCRCVLVWDGTFGHFPDLDLNQMIADGATWEVPCVDPSVKWLWCAYSPE